MDARSTCGWVGARLGPPYLLTGALFRFAPQDGSRACHQLHLLARYVLSKTTDDPTDGT